MTARETERLAKVEQKVDDLAHNTEKGFADIKTQLEGAIARMDNLNKSFLTVAQAKVAAWMIGLAISVATIAIMLWSVAHKQ